MINEIKPYKHLLQNLLESIRLLQQEISKEDGLYIASEALKEIAENIEAIKNK